MGSDIQRRGEAAEEVRARATESDYVLQMDLTRIPTVIDGMHRLQAIQAVEADMFNRDSDQEQEST